MCGLYGFIRYGNKLKDLDDLTNALAEQAAVRGTDATGIAFCNNSGLTVLKDGKSAYRLDFKHSDEIVAVIGHTRHSTQGSEKRNYNNHPFSGHCINRNFVLAHNGVLNNDKELRKKYKLPNTRIETDSYISVQLIEHKRRLDFESIRFMAEETEGSFSYSILDDRNNVWLVKGDSPLSILHFPEKKIYVYASTDEILYKALVDYSPLFAELKKGKAKKVEITEGEIFKIRPDGKIERGKFEYSYYYGKGWWDYGYISSRRSDNGKGGYTENDYLEDIKSVAQYNGYSPDDIDHLVSEGFTLEEIEEYIYCCCGGEI